MQPVEDTLLFDKELLGTSYVAGRWLNAWDPKVQKAEEGPDIMMRETVKEQVKKIIMDWHIYVWKGKEMVGIVYLTWYG